MGTHTDDAIETSCGTISKRMQAALTDPQSVVNDSHASLD